MTTQIRNGFVRVGENVVETLGRSSRRKSLCSGGKFRYSSEPDALEGLVRVRKERIASPDGRLPENRIYFCERCDGWHLSSRELHPIDLQTVRERSDGETWQEYSRRLERKIAGQRGELVSLLALGHGGGNRELRKRVPTLLIALGHANERWMGERRNRQNLTEILSHKHPLCWLLWRLTLGVHTSGSAAAEISGRDSATAEATTKDELA